MEEDKNELFVGREDERLLQFINRGVRHLRIARFRGPAVARIVVEGVLDEAVVAGLRLALEVGDGPAHLEVTHLHDAGALREKFHVGEDEFPLLAAREFAVGM